MDAALHRRLLATTEQLRAHPIPKAQSTEATYADKLRDNWSHYALQHDLPTTFTPTTTPLTTEQIFAFIVASKRGTTRRHTRDGAQRAEREHQSLAPATLDGVLAALRHTHQSNGLTWAGSDTRIRDAVRAYGNTSDHIVTQAAPMTPQHLARIFGTTPTSNTVGTKRARDRAIALALNLPLAALPTIDPDSVTTTATRVEVTLPSGETRTAPCLLTHCSDPIAAAACAHCLLRTWSQTNHPAPLIDTRDLTAFRASTKRAAAHLPLANLNSDHLTVTDDDLWTTIALGLSPECVHWLRMRAVLLPMFVTGLRLDDIDNLGTQHVALTHNATLSIVGKTEPATRPHIVTLTPETGPLCPVSAMRNYDTWVRAYLHNRDTWTPALRGKHAPHPVDTTRPPDSRALYQAARLWLLEQGIDIDHTPGTRTTLTPHSARRGFAQEAEAKGNPTDDISQAMRHKRPDTTQKYLTRTATSTATHMVETLAGTTR